MFAPDDLKSLALPVIAVLAGLVAALLAPVIGTIEAETALLTWLLGAALVAVWTTDQPR